MSLQFYFFVNFGSHTGLNDAGMTSDFGGVGNLITLRIIPNNSQTTHKKVKILSLQKGFPNLGYTLSSVSVLMDLAMAMDR